MKNLLFSLVIAIGIFLPDSVDAQVVNVTVDVTSGQHPISPYIYGRNNLLSSNPQQPLSSADWQFLRDAGVKIVRENGGNNATKYNWRRKITSHPDWYNNVYDNNWDYEVKSMQDNIPSLTGIWSFQLIGRVAASKAYNFNDWGYNQSQWWTGVNQNLAGGGQPNTTGGNKALTEGNSELYTMAWPADSTVEILTHWLNNLHIDKSRMKYWNMDNEVEIWGSTHDDVMKTQITAEEMIQRYVAVAKKARALFPEIKLMGPVTANEWQWYSYNTGKIPYQGKNYVWLEYFIKRIAEEQTTSGVKLLDVLDIHFYPGETRAEDIVQGHRVYFDKNYVYPGANGVKVSGSGGWDNTINKEYIFERCKEWLNQYMGANHGVGLGVTETGINIVNPNVTAVWYASVLGEFAKQNVEVFTPWHWDKGMWETLHLFSRYGKEKSVQAISGNETYISAYPSLSTNNDSLTIFLVNRYVDKSQEVRIQLPNFTAENGSYNTLTLDNLPAEETFKSHTVNALKKGTVTASNNAITITLPKMSVTAVLLKGRPSSAGKIYKEDDIKLFPNPAGQFTTLSFSLDSKQDVGVMLYDPQGKLIKTCLQETMQAGSHNFTITTNELKTGIYFLKVSMGKDMVQKKLVVQQ